MYVTGIIILCETEMSVQFIDVVVLGNLQEQLLLEVVCLESHLCQH